MVRATVRATVRTKRLEFPPIPRSMEATARTKAVDKMEEGVVAAEGVAVVEGTVVVGAVADASALGSSTDHGMLDGLGWFEAASSYMFNFSYDGRRGRVFGGEEGLL